MISIGPAAGLHMGLLTCGYGTAAGVARGALRCRQGLWGGQGEQANATMHLYPIINGACHRVGADETANHNIRPATLGRFTAG
jgi:hypothetical protein